MIGEDDKKMAGAEGSLFDSPGADPAGAVTRDTVARAFELAHSGLYTTMEAITGQLKSEGLEAVDALLFDAAIRKALRQACAEARIALLRRDRIG
jgi:hypothetical protein